VKTTVGQCPWCSQPEGHSGPCGKVLEQRPAPVVITKPIVVKFENAQHAIIVMRSDGTLRVWWLRHGRWEAEQQMLCDRYQLEPTEGEVVVLVGTIGKTTVRHVGHRIHRLDAAKMLAAHPSPTESLKGEQDWDAGILTSWQKKMLGIR